jgi:predicted permease
VILPGVAYSISDENRLPEQFFGAFTSANLFTVIGQRPFIGRDFTPEDDRPGAAPVAILGYGLWQSRYAGDPGILGRTLRVNGLSPTVVGVMGPDMRFPPNSDLWIPVSQTNTPRVEGRGVRSFSVVARLAEGVTLEQARAELSTLARETARDFPQSNQDLVPELQTYRERANGPQVKVMYWSLLGAGVLVLLIACVNVANLLLARAIHRTREVSIRVALGADRGRIVRQLLVESVSLASIGGALSIPLVFLGVRLFDLMTQDAGRPYYVTLTTDLSVFAVVAGVCVIVGIGFGLAPAWHSARTDVNAGIREGVDPRGRRLWAASATASQVALAVMLLSGTGLLLRSVLNLYTQSLGFDRPDVIVMQLPLPGGRYPTSADRLAFMQRVDERLAGVAAIEAASSTSNTPFGGGPAVQLSIDGGQTGTAERAPLVTMVAIGARYFDVLGSPVLRGRSFTDIDGLAGRDVAIVNQRFVEVYFADRDPIGHYVQLTQNPALRTISGVPARPLTIVGVSPTIRQASTRELEPDAVVYVPRPSVAHTNRATLLVRSRRGQAETTAVLREEIRALDPDMPIFNVRTLETDLANQRWPLVVASSTFGLFAGIGVALCAVGVFGLASYSLATRTREMALRLVLGAMPRHVLWRVLRGVAVQVAIGLALGVLGAYGVGRLVEGMLVQTAPADPRVLTVVAVVLMLAALAACVVPARRAMRVDPLTILRSGRA